MLRKVFLLERFTILLEGEINVTLDIFHEEKNVKTKSKVRWNGKDFRGDKCYPQAITFMNQYPKVFEWLHTRPRNAIQLACDALKQFCEYSDLTPDDFLALDKKQARDLLWKYIETIKMEHPRKAQITKAYVKNFFLYHNEEHLVFIRGKHDIVYEPKRLKYDMRKEICWRIIHKAKTLRDEALLIMAYESGLRRNAIASLIYGHYKNFLWFRKDGDTITPSDVEHGNIAIFKVMASKNPEYTYDKKLRGKRINWYYACLHEEATKILKEYVEKYHHNSKDDMPFWYPLKPLNKNKRLGVGRIYKMLKGCVRRAGLPNERINFHALRRGFRRVVRNTSEITDNEFKEAIMGHKLKGSQEAYFDKNPIEFAREYTKCDFSPPTPKKEKEIERLREKVKALSEKRVEAKKELAIPDGPLGGPRIKQPIKSELVTPSKQPKSSEVLMERPKEPGLWDWVLCPVTNQNVSYSSCVGQCRIEEPSNYERCKKEGWKIV